MLEFAPDAIIGVDASGVIVLANQQAADLFGFARGELHGQEIELLVPDVSRSGHPLHRARYFADPRRRAMGAGLDLAGRRRDGTEFPAEISLSSLDADGNRIALVAVRDVSEQRAAAQVQARLAAIVESSGDAIIGHRRDGAITSWNPAAEALYGYTEGEVLGRSVALLQWGAVADQLGPPDLEPTREADAVHLHKDGSRLEVVQTISRVRGRGNEDHGMATIVRDVSAARRAQRTFEGLLEFAPDAILGVGEDGTIALANRRAEALFGYGREELVGVGLEQLVPRRVMGRHAAHRRSYLADPKARPMGQGLELAGRRRDGSEFPAEISLSSLETAEGTIAVAAVRDISERSESDRERSLQRELAQARRLESVGQLAGGIAHDFNNLLGVILSLSELVLDELPEEGVAREDLNEITAAAQRAAALTRQLLIFSRREMVKTEVVDPAELVRDLEMLLHRALGERVELEVGVTEPVASVLADRGQLEQVLVNLAVNARDAMPDGGRLSVRVATVDLDVRQAESHLGLSAGPHVRITVQDTGVGMPPEVIERAFEPFFTTKGRTQGTGLGLATVYGIVTDAGGHVALHSEPGEGTTVELHLPATDRASEALAAPRPTPASGRGERVLVVEDEPRMRDVAARILRQGGFEVVVAGDAAEALELAKGADIDLVVSDVIMPGMLGPDLAGALRVARPQLKVLFMSGYSHKVLDAGAVDEPGLTAFIEKPFTRAQLCAAARTLLDTRAPA
ncbi:MAG: PAS domain S-box protein [Solirubrobacteraceae bacterium]|nr:PAS domain S-box protein [Solirubrobacteraceae bacterium]